MGGSTPFLYSDKREGTGRRSGQGVDNTGFKTGGCCVPDDTRGVTGSRPERPPSAPQVGEDHSQST